MSMMNNLLCRPDLCIMFRQCWGVINVFHEHRIPGVGLFILYFVFSGRHCHGVVGWSNGIPGIGY